MKTVCRSKNSIFVFQSDEQVIKSLVLKSLICAISSLHSALDKNLKKTDKLKKTGQNEFVFTKCALVLNYLFCYNYF